MFLLGSLVWINLGERPGGLEANGTGSAAGAQGEQGHDIQDRVGSRSTKSKARQPLANARAEEKKPERKYSYEESLDRLQAIRKAFHAGSVDFYEDLDEVFESLDSEQIMALTNEVLAMKDESFLYAVSSDAMSRLVEQRIPAGRLQEWLGTMGSSPERSHLVGMAGEQFMATGRAGFGDFVAGFESDDDKGKLLAGYYCRLAIDQPEVALREFLAAKPKSIPYSLLSEVVGNVTEAANFKNLAGMLLPDSEPGAAQVRSTLLKEWADADPKQAAIYAWTSTEASPAQIAVVIEQWCKSDPKRAGEWLLSQGPSPKSEVAVRAVIRTRATSAPSESWGLVSLIQDPKVRTEAYREVYEKWKRYRPEDAETAWRQVQAKP